MDAKQPWFLIVIIIFNHFPSDSQIKLPDRHHAVIIQIERIIYGRYQGMGKQSAPPIADLQKRSPLLQMP